MQIELKPSSTDMAGPTDELRQEVVEGLLYTHSRLSANTSKTLEATSFLYAVIELLAEKGLIEIETLDERKHAVARRLTQRFRSEQIGVMFQDPEYDKYTFEQGAQVDCATRVHLCKASCCRLPFALSRQDVNEGIVRWDLGRPYVIDQGSDGYCNHMRRGSCVCTIYERRPVPCRGYDCSQDDRIWLDFQAMIPNPALEQPDWPYCLSGDNEGVSP